MPVPQWFSELLPQLSNQQAQRLYSHFEILERWNRKMNLTSVRDSKEIVIRHYCESLFFGEHFPEAASIADIGSGAGFPGVPLAIQRPQSRVTLVESNQRKAVFLRESTRGLANIAVLAKRAQDLSGPFEWVVSRAVDPQEVASLVPKLAPNVGLMIGEEDFSALKGLSHIAWSDPVRLPWGDRRLCVYGCST